MKIKQDSVVTVDYTLRAPEGEVLDTSQGAAPLSYLHGRGQIIPGFERELEGKTKGDELRFQVPPAEGYGEHDPAAFREVNKSAFPADVELQKGQQFLIADEHGNQRPVCVDSVQDETVRLDLNHPLAGMTLDFEVQVREVRDATAEELAHGHAHGPEGHAHD